MRFVAVDVETANPQMSSICQIGLVRFEDGRETAAEARLVDPQTWFDEFNVDIHGIDEDQIRGAPTFPELHEWICRWTSGEVVACHTHFDRVALTRARELHRLNDPTCRWLDTAKVARRAWSQFASAGYGLANVAEHCGIEFKHHDALEDARTAGLILLRAMEATGEDLAQWMLRATRPIGGAKSIRRSGDGDGGLLGEVIVFTGALQLARREAADLAAGAGGDVHPGVTKRTTMLVVGDQDIQKLQGREKSSKHLKAEALMSAGQQIRIVGESDFMALASITD